MNATSTSLIAFPNATSTSSKKALNCDSMLGAYTCRYTEIATAALALENKPFLPVVPSQRYTQPCWGSQVSQHQLEQTLLHERLSKKFSSPRSTRQFQNPGALSMKFPQYQDDTAGLRKQAPALFLSVTKRFNSRQLDPSSLVQLNYIFCTLPTLASPNA